MGAVTPLNQANKTQNFYPIEGKWIMKKFPFKASTAIEEGSAVAVEVSGSNPTGYITSAGTTQANGANIVGILAEPIASTDSDYATAGKLKGVWVAADNTAECLFTVGSGTFTAADVGRTTQLANAKSVAVDTNGNAFIITGYTSATRGIGKFGMAPVQTA